MFVFWLAIFLRWDTSVFKFAPSPVHRRSLPQQTPTPVVENKYYRITVDPETGAVESIFDKQLDRELVDHHSPYKFGQYLYVTGGDPKGDGLTRMIHPFQALPIAELTIHPATGGKYLGAETTPWGHSIKLHSSDVNTPAIDLEILLYDDQKRIDFDYSVQKSYTTAKEGVYFAFPTAVQSPEFAYAHTAGMGRSRARSVEGRQPRMVQHTEVDGGPRLRHDRRHCSSRCVFGELWRHQPRAVAQ